MSKALTKHFATHPELADAIIDRAIQGSDAADREKAERELRRRPKPEPTSSLSEEGSKK